MAKADRIRGLSLTTPLRTAAPRILSVRIGEIERHEAGLPGKDAIHAMRVATRRLRAALRLLGLRDHDPRVKKLQDALGAVRDLQLQVAWLRERDAELAARREKLRGRAQAALGDALSEWHAKTLPVLLAPQKVSGKLGGRAVRKRLRKRLTRFEERLERAIDRGTAADLHLLRISVKQLRYLFEVMQAASPQLSRKLLEELGPLQAALGELHDADVRVQLLSRHRRAELLREQRDAREQLAKVADAELSRWKRQDIAGEARRQLE